MDGLSARRNLGTKVETVQSVGGWNGLDSPPHNMNQVAHSNWALSQGLTQIFAAPPNIPRLWLATAFLASKPHISYFAPASHSHV